MLGSIFICSGVISLVGAILSTFRTLHFLRVARRTTGTVTELRESKSTDNGQTTFAPVFRFEDASGIEHTVASSHYSAPPAFHVGEKVNILFRADDPADAEINTFWQVWGTPCLCGIIGGIFLPAGIIALNAGQK